jgi:quercetin dioxygenase-like cupin family protein
MMDRRLFSVFARAAVPVAALAVGFAVGTKTPTSAREAADRFIPLFITNKSVMDEPIVYPAGPAKLTANILNLVPGEETGWHTHGVPLAGIVLEGEITVDYGDKGTKTFRQGDAIAEAINVPHNGKNTGTAPLRVFVLYMGAEGLPIGIPVKK